MKKIVVSILIILCIYSNIYAQKNQIFEEYAVVSAFGLITGKSIRVDYGEGDLTMVDSTDNNQKIKSVGQALNYMSKKGWILVSTGGSINQGSFFVFKRLRRKEE
jgi:hypothetical protein